jgi:hypothetical protein
MVLPKEMVEIAGVTQELMKRPPEERLLLLRVFVGMISTLSSELGDSADIAFARFLRSQLNSSVSDGQAAAYRQVILAMLARTRFGSMTFSREELMSQGDGRVELAVPDGHDEFIVVYNADFVSGRVQ